jgi:stearoyl-CoA desaturase (delta-9 desaturase)
VAVSNPLPSLSTRSGTMTNKKATTQPTTGPLLRLSGDKSRSLTGTIDWLNVPVLILLPMYGIYQAFFTTLRRETLIWSFVCYNYGILSSTAGYHRLWSHRSYTASLPLRIFFALGGAMNVQMSIRWWAARHRAHHRYTDTNKDPYSTVKGFWHAHMGWLILKPKKEDVGRVDTSDLDQVS